MEKAPPFLAGPVSREVARPVLPYSSSARLSSAGNGLNDRVRHRTPDVSREYRSWFRSIAPGDDNAEWLRRAVILTILFHSNSHLVDATACLERVIGTPYAMFDVARK